MTMLTFIARRLALLMVVVLGMSLITFSLTHLVPGNPARLLAGPHARQEQVDALAHQYGLDRPLPQQYWIYLTGLARGDLGQSLTTRRPVLDDLRQYLPATIELTLAALILTVAIGVPLGLLSAANHRRLLDHLTRLGAIAGVSLPVFWLGLVLQLLLYKQLGVLPIGGRLGTFDSEPAQITGLYLVDALLGGQWATFGSAVAHLLLPAATLCIGSLAIVTRMMRASVLDALHHEYVLVARAKGLTQRAVLVRHVLRNAFLPTLTVLGLQVGYLLSGNFVAEAVFNWPGVGLYAVTAIRNLDYSAIMGVTLIVSVVYVVINLLVDLLYAVLDPRIRFVGPG